VSPPPNHETTSFAMTSFFMLPPPTCLATINDRPPSTHNTNLPHTCNTTNWCPLRESQIALRQARTRMSQTSSSCEWLECNISSGGGWLRERTRTRGRRGKKVIRDFWTLTRKLVFGSGSIPPEAENTFWPRFNSNQGQMSLLQWHFWNISQLLGFESSKLRHIRPFDISFLMNRDIKVEKNCKITTAPFYASIKRQLRPITRVKRSKLH